MLGLLAALDRSERVERVDHRYAVRPCGLQRRQPRHPEVRVHDVGGSVRQRSASRSANSHMSGSSSSLGTGVAGPASTCSTSTPRPSVTTSGSSAPSRRVKTRTRAPRSSECLRERSDVDVLTAGVDPAEQRQRAGVLGHHVDARAFDLHHLSSIGAGPHAAISSISSSQSARKRPRP